MVILCALFLSRGVTRPLALLAEGARRVAAGSPGSRVEISTSDEIGELADNFNKMARTEPEN
jgi:HAMP domain-containing protein